jgi:outer membrane protein assembly factor BamD (BamD/ComL family)
MRAPLRFSFAPLAALLAACAAEPARHTLADLHSVRPDVAEVEVQDSLDLAMQSYRRFLDQTATSAMTPEAMRRLADLELEKEFGIAGGSAAALPAPKRAFAPGAQRDTALVAPVAQVAPEHESDADFERRATQQQEVAAAQAQALDLPGAEGLSQSGPLEAIAIYKKLLAEYPNYERADQVIYQMARAYDELGQTEEAMESMQRLVDQYGYSKYSDEVQFRRAEYFFTRSKYRDAEKAYQAITAMGPRSEYYELALYKLGWTLYKQDFYEEALHQYIALLDYKRSIGYDFDQRHEEEDERRVADTFRVISLSFSNLGGPEVLPEYFATNGGRDYEDRIYRNLGEYYLEKLRYQDAAAVYASFVKQHALHRASPSFSMRVIEIYQKGDFPMLVVESKKSFAKDYGLRAEYWRHFDVNESPEVLSYLKTNLRDLASHYHSLYQDANAAEDKPANYREALAWYREFLASFPQDAESPSINYQVADLLLENKDFAEAATEYERTAYEYPTHERSSAAGYAAIYAHREHLKVVGDAQRVDAQRATIASSLKFADTFPEHEHAAAVLGAAADDLYEMKDFPLARESARKLVDRYPAADAALRRPAWTIVAHSSFELEDYAAAEAAYAHVLELTPAEDAGRQALVDNLAASIYKQGELANTAGDYRAAADHFLRLKDAAPTSKVRPAAQYDAAVALLKLEDWNKAADVLDEFRRDFPNHELNSEATKQLAFAYRQGGKTALAAGEYERVAAEAKDPELGRQALLAAADLYEQSADRESALNVYARYVATYPQPVEVALETRSKMAEMYKAKGDTTSYEQQLHEIVARDASAGAERTNRTKYLAAKAGLVLSEQLYAKFVELKLAQPFKKSLAAKRERMDAAMQSFEDLTDYEVAEVTAAATYYMAEIYWNFNRSLVESERPTGLDAATAAEYEDALEEQAFPFEEKAIEVHEKNRELIVSGVYNDWTKKSLAKLAELVPGRYAKSEISSGFLPAIDVYAYRAPSAVRADAAVVQAAAAPGASPQAAAAPPAPAESAQPSEPASAEPAAPGRIREAAVEAGHVAL